MAERTFQAETQEGVRGCLNKPEYSDEVLKCLKITSPACQREWEACAGVNWWRRCEHCSAIETETESLCCSECQQCQILLLLNRFVPQSDLETPGKTFHFCKLLLIFCLITFFKSDWSWLFTGKSAPPLEYTWVKCCCSSIWKAVDVALEGSKSMTCW